MSETPTQPPLFRVAAMTELRAGPGPDQPAVAPLAADAVVTFVATGPAGWLEVETARGQRGFAPQGLLRRQAEGAKPPQHAAQAFPWRNPERVNRDPKMLHPLFRNRALRTVARLNAEGIPFGIYEGLRSPWRQNHLHGQGRERPGRLVTWAEPWTSYHQFGLAADFVLVMEGRWSWDDDGQLGAWWDRLWAVGRDEGLEPIGRERPHMQLAGLELAELRAGRLPPCTDALWTSNWRWMVESWDGKPAAPRAMA